MNAADEILTAGDVAGILKISSKAVYRLRAQGSLLARFKLFEGERGWRWTRQDVDRYLENIAVSDQHVALAMPSARSIVFASLEDKRPAAAYVKTKDRTRAGKFR